MVVLKWLIATKYVCHKWPQICFVCRNHNPVLSSFMPYHRICDKSNMTMPLVDQELLPLQEHMSSPPVSCWSIFSFLSSVLQSIVSPFVLFSFCNCIDLRFGLPLWYLQAFYDNLFLYSQTCFKGHLYITSDGL